MAKVKSYLENEKEIDNRWLNAGNVVITKTHGYGNPFIVTPISKETGARILTSISGVSAYYTLTIYNHMTVGEWNNEVFDKNYVIVDMFESDEVEITVSRSKMNK